ncbi:MAG: protoheme IX farnesyltransferase [Ignavibacteriales bacterium]|nr:MAG: protoheme IX farnesyltransferase [Ignavibacteriales bacterium]
MKNKFQIFAEITKLRITIFVTVTTMFGFIAATDSIDSQIILPALGILLLACGSAALNHYQERKTDSLMERTKSRPIPSGKISAKSTIQISILLVVLGSVLLFIGSGILALSLGLLNLIWYNAVYTPLKKVSPLAIIPGSLVGAIPPVVGWVAGSGNILDPQIILISFFFFIWQIPHFWLLLMVLDKDYRKAGFPTLTQIFSQHQLGRITFMWIIATGVTGLLLPLFQISHNQFVNYSLFIAALLLAFKSMNLLQRTQETSAFSFAFRSINYFALFVVLVVSIDKLFVS